MMDTANYYLRACEKVKISHSFMGGMKSAVAGR